MAVIPNHQCRLIRRGHFACHLRLIAAPQMVQHGQPKTLRDPVGGQPGTITVVVGIRSRGIDATRFHQLIVVLTGVGQTYGECAGSSPTTRGQAMTGRSTVMVGAVWPIRFGLLSVPRDDDQGLTHDCVSSNSAKSERVR